ncbi:uncharacterized protein LOC135841957 isoform X2 [Planococcus citri]|uniref:uncharacterized protein LOC135841957 isoform X2 n=1 Tax=Planococcus citri TaxID=170843 RepID=UPI0031F93CF0
MHRSLIFFVVLYQADACIDLLARSFNEVFSPMIETGDGRIQKPHNVDDLTDYYKVDESGGIVPNIHLVGHPLQHLLNHDRAKPVLEDEDLLLQSRNSDHKLQSRTTTAPDSGDGEISTADQDQENTIPSSSGSQNGTRKKYKYRGGNYVPGRRPIVDFFIKLIEMFQLTSESKFITSRPRYGNGQLQYVPNTYHDIY